MDQARLTRRSMLAGTFSLAAGGEGLLRADQNEIATNGHDTFIAIIDEGPMSFSVGVRTKVEADLALVTVFYHVQVHLPEVAKLSTLLLSKQLLAPIAGFNAYGVTDIAFLIPREKIEFIRIRFLKDVVPEQRARLG